MISILLTKVWGGWFYVRMKAKSSRFKAIRTVNKILYTLYLRECGAWIGLETRFKSKPYFPHGILGVFISNGAVIGKDVIIYQHVTIGSNSVPGSSGFGSPVIGDNVLIGAGAKIIGNCTIGNRVRIGANAVITTDVPDDCVVVCGKSRVIQKPILNNNIDQLFRK